MHVCNVYEGREREREEAHDLTCVRWPLVVLSFLLPFRSPSPSLPPIAVLLLLPLASLCLLTHSLFAFHLLFHRKYVQNAKGEREREGGRRSSRRRHERKRSRGGAGRKA